MPFIETKTNVTVSKEAETKIKEALGQAISIIPGKSENWLMLAIEGDIPMYFRGDDSAPIAFVDVKTFGTAYAAENRNRAVTMVLEKNYLEAKKILVEHRDLLDRMASELLEKITLVRMDIQRIMNESINETA